MDKLDLDARLATLERRVATLSVLCAFLVTGAAAVLFFALVARPTPRIEAQTMAVESVKMPTPPSIAIDFTEGTAGHLAHELDELAGLKREDLVTDTEYKGKKAQILAKSFVRSTNLRAELERLGQLHQDGVLSGDEYSALKAKVLDIGK